MDLTELQPFLDLVPQPVFVLRSITGEILLANSSACLIYGLVPDDFDTKTIGDLRVEVVGHQAIDQAGG